MLRASYIVFGMFSWLVNWLIGKSSSEYRVEAGGGLQPTPRIFGGSKNDSEYDIVCLF